MIISLTSALIGIFAFVTGKTSLQDLDLVIDPSFFVTFFKTIVVLFGFYLALAGAWLTFLYDLFAYFFLDSATVLNYSKDVLNWGWNELVIDWYWDKSNGIHIVISVLLFTLIIVLIDKTNK